MSYILLSLETMQALAIEITPGRQRWAVIMGMVQQPRILKLRLCVKEKRPDLFFNCSADQHHIVNFQSNTRTVEPPQAAKAASETGTQGSISD